VLRVIREVLFFEPKRIGTDIPKALHYLNSVTKRRAVVFLLSDFMADEYDRALKIANKRHDVIAVTVTDPREETLPDVGLVAVRDAESGRETLVDTSDSVVRQRYAEEMKRRAARREQSFRSTKVDAMHVRTDRSYVDEIHRFFRMREKRKA
jgi:uncharacterized protein (DUF58 family)